MYKKSNKLNLFKYDEIIFGKIIKTGTALGSVKKDENRGII